MIRKSPLARVLLCLAALTLVAATALATRPRTGIVTTADGRRVIATQALSKFTAAEPESDAKLKTISGNLSDFPFGVYFCCYGDTIAGPNAGFGHTYWAAVGFTPSADVTVTKLEASVGFAAGTNEVVLSLNNDNNGVPGTVIKHFRAENLGTFGSCCILAKATSKSGIALTKGTPYWLVVSTDKKSANTFAAWAFNSTDMRGHLGAFYADGTWTANSSSLLGGYAVLGN